MTFFNLSNYAEISVKNKISNMDVSIPFFFFFYGMFLYMRFQSGGLLSSFLFYTYLCGIIFMSCTLEEGAPIFKYRNCNFFLLLFVQKAFFFLHHNLVV